MDKLENRYIVEYDLKKKTVTDAEYKQGSLDTSILQLIIKNEGIVENLTGEEIEFRFYKKDGTIVFQDFTTGVNTLDAPNGVVQCNLRTDTLSCAGPVNFELYRKLGAKELIMPSFVFVVKSSIGADGAISKNYISSIENKLLEMDTLINRLKDIDVVVLQGDILEREKTTYVNDKLLLKADKEDFTNFKNSTVTSLENIDAELLLKIDNEEFNNFKNLNTLNLTETNENVTNNKEDFDTFKDSAETQLANMTSQVESDIFNNASQINDTKNELSSNNNALAQISKANDISKLLSIKNITANENLISNIFLGIRPNAIDAGVTNCALSKSEIFDFCNQAITTIGTTANGVGISILKYLTSADIGKILQFGFIVDKSVLTDFSFAGIIAWKDGVNSTFLGTHKIANTVLNLGNGFYFWQYKATIVAGDIGTNTVLEKLFFKLSSTSVPYIFKMMLPIATLSPVEVNLLDEIVKQYNYTTKKIGFNQDMSPLVSFYNGYWKKTTKSLALDAYVYLPLMRTDETYRHCPSRTVGFYTNSKTVKINYYGEGDSIEVKINDNPITTLVSMLNNATWNTLIVTDNLDISKYNKIEIIVKYKLTLAGFEIDSNASLKPIITKAKKMLFYGDSIANGGTGSTKPTMGFVYKTANNLGLQCINQGVPGSAMYIDGRDRVATDIVANSDYVFILYGSNDLGNATSAVNFQLAYDTCIKAIKSQLPNAKIFVGTLLKRSDEVTQGVKFTDYQTAIKTVCSDNSCTLVDTYLAIPNSSITYLVDGIHPNDVGHGLIADYITSEIKGQL